MSESMPKTKKPEAGVNPVYNAMLKLAEKHGVSVCENEIEQFGPNGVYTHYCKSGIELHLIIIDSNLEIEKKIFVLGHELGHYALHQKRMDEIHNKNKLLGLTNHYDNEPKMEKDANEFAERLISFVTRHLTRKLPNAA